MRSSDSSCKGHALDEVVQRLMKLIATKKIGDPADPTVDLGPLAAEHQVVGMESQVADAVRKGAKVIIGRKADRSSYGCLL